MIPALLAGGAALSALGTGASMYGAYQRDAATRRALRDYQNAVNARAGQEQQALGQEQGVLSGLSRERQAGIGSYLTDLAAAQRPTTDGGFGQRNTGALSDIREMTQGPDGTYTYSGAPRSQADTMQAGKTGTDNRRLAEALLADYELGQIQEREQSAGHRMAFGDLMRSTKGASLQERFALAKALRDLDWQRKTAAMQKNLDEAGRKGQWLSVLGGLGTQLGGLGMSAGMMGGGGAAPGAPGAAPVAGPVSPAAAAAAPRSVYAYM